MKWSHLGCYDNSLVEMSSLEGNSNILSADIATRADAVDMCFYASRMHNHKVSTHMLTLNTLEEITTELQVI